MTARRDGTRRATLGALRVALSALGPALGPALGAALGAALWAAPAMGQGIALSVPVDCLLGEECHIQQYVDRDPGPGAADHRCGPRSYDGHKGTDIMLPSRAAMDAGVRVLAAAPGTVIGARDGMADIPRSDPAAPEIEGRECGNGVRLAHEGGWETQYCHMAEGSVAVAEGETVARGHTLGRVGVSGAAEVAHLHLQVTDPQGRIVDPFDARPMEAACAAEGGPAETLWADPGTMAYRAGGLAAAGILPEAVDFETVKESAPHEARLAAGSPAIVLYALGFGLEAGDRIALRLIGPAGGVVAETGIAMERDRALEFRLVGRRGTDWPRGTYRGQATLTRDGVVIDRIGVAATVE